MTRSSIYSTVDAVALLAVACGLFVATGSAVLWLLPAAAGDVSSLGLLIRAMAGLVLACAPTVWLWRRRSASNPEPVAATAPWSLREFILLLLLLPFFVPLALQLDAYPWAAPDEIHHLNVAKNLAEHGVYGSGNPDTGFRWFDPYDSVGPTVILPVAGVFALVGPELSAGRLVIWLYFAALCTGLYLLVRSRYGILAAAATAFLLPLTMSSLYLARTVYGEVPAWAFVVWGLVAWQAALERRGWLLPLIAGACFGLAVLTKTILALLAFPLAAVWLADGFGGRRLTWRTTLLPAVAAFVVLATWSLVQMLWSDTPAARTEGTLSLYRHYLLFGFEPLPATLGQLLKHFYFHGVLLLCALYAVQRFRHDPPLLALWLGGGFFVFWYVFFTPGQLPRYLWYSYVAALPAVALALAGITKARRSILLRVAAAVLVLTPFGLWGVRQYPEILTNSEMADDYWLAAFLQDLPEAATLGTNFFPLPGTLQFLGGPAITLGEDSPRDFRAYVWAPGTAPRNRPPGVERTHAGRYTIDHRLPIESP